MSEIDFLGGKKGDDEKKSETKGGQNADLVWSKPEASSPDKKTGPFSFLPFLNKKSADKALKKEPAAMDKNKIKQSRQEILKLIKSHKAGESKGAGENSGNFFNSLGEKFAKEPKHKEILIDYQKVFAEEKNKRSPAAGQASPIEPAPAIVKKIQPVKYWSNFFKFIKEKLRLWTLPKPKAVKAEPKPNQPESAKQAIAADDNSEFSPPVLETNLIKEEIVTFFDWQRKIFALISAILLPVFLVGAIYLGLIFYQKESQAKNLSLINRYNELADTIKQEEVGVKQIFDFQNKLKLVSQIFSQHIYWSNFFKFLEDNTIRDVYFGGFAGDTGGNYSLNAAAVDYGNISEQVNALKSNSKIKSVSANGGELIGSGDKDNGAKVKFNLEFSISNSIFTE